MNLVDESQQGYHKAHLEDMEKEIYLDKYVVSYTGYFNYKEFMSMFNKWCEANGYYRDVQSSGEKVGEKSTTKSFGIQLQKKISHYHFSVLNIDLSFKMVDVEKEVDGKMQNMQKGDVEAVFHGYLMSSMKARWETRGFIYFFRMLIDKFVYKLDKPKYWAVCATDGKALGAEMNGLLNSFNGRVKE